MTSSSSAAVERDGTEGAGSGGARPTGPGGPRSHAALTTEHGQTRIADAVVGKIAGLAAREIPGVYSMGTGFARRMGQLRSLVPGSTETDAAAQGVSVEVGERETAVDLDVVTWYGQSIVEVTEAVRSNVIERVEGMTGLRVVEVNINVDDIYVEGQDDNEPSQSRVQ
ncbi:Asp23/Gls24 family envelope stress response protein [Actinocatenispora sera]|nr:Asp23/Gls24 family envelope stress response protein [Actinocatenispora sera]